MDLRLPEPGDCQAEGKRAGGSGPEVQGVFPGHGPQAGERGQPAAPRRDHQGPGAG